MKTVGIFFLSLLFLIPNIGYSTEIVPLEVLEECQGEGCGCTAKSITNKPFVLYKETESSSKPIGKFKVGTQAKAGKALTKVLDPGQAVVVEIATSKVNLKVGDKVTHLFYIGEGYYKVKKGGQGIHFLGGDIKLKSLKEPSYEFWLEIQVGDINGFTPSFPFESCLE